MACARRAARRSRPAAARGRRSGSRALEGQHAHAAELADGHGRGRAHHAVHGRRHDRQVEAEGVDLPRQVDVLGVPGAPAGHEGQVVEPVGPPTRLSHADLDLSHASCSSTRFRERSEPTRCAPTSRRPRRRPACRGAGRPGEGREGGQRLASGVADARRRAGAVRRPTRGCVRRRRTRAVRAGRRGRTRARRGSASSSKSPTGGRAVAWSWPGSASVRRSRLDLVGADEAVGARLGRRRGPRPRPNDAPSRSGRPGYRVGDGP